MCEGEEDGRSGMNETCLPAETTRVDLGRLSSIEVGESARVMEWISDRLRRSHHLREGSRIGMSKNV